MCLGSKPEAPKATPIQAPPPPPPPPPKLVSPEDAARDGTDQATSKATKKARAGLRIDLGGVQAGGSGLGIPTA